MKLLSLTIEGAPIQAPPEVQNIVNKAGEAPFGQNIIKLGVELVLIGVILLALFYLIYGGIKLIISRGEKQMVQQAREQMMYAILGLIIAFSSFFILAVIGKIFGIKLIGF